MNAHFLFDPSAVEIVSAKSKQAILEQLARRFAQSYGLDAAAVSVCIDTGALSTLDTRERFIVEQRMLADEELSLAEIGRQLGVSRERARQLEARAKKKLRKSLADLEEVAA